MAKRKTKRPSVYDDLRTSASGLSKAVSAVLRRQDEMEKDLDKLEAKLDKQETKYDKLERKSDKLDAKLDALEVKADKLESKYDRLETKFDKVERKEDRKRQAAMKAGETVVSQPLRIQLPDLPSVQAFRQSSRAIAAALRSRPAPARRARRLDTMLARGQFDEIEAELDQNEADVDKDERELDGLEKLADTTEKTFDEDEKRLDTLESLLDKLEAALDAERDRERARKGEVARRRSATRAAPPQRPSPRVARGARRRLGAGQLTRLVARLRSGGSQARRAARAIEQSGDAAVPILLRSYATAEEHQRWEIVNLLGYIKDPRAIPLLLARGIQDEELHPRWRSIWALTAVDDGSVRQRLRRALRQTAGVRRRNIAVALSLYGDRSAVPALRSALRSRRDWDRWEAASCLAGYRHDGAANDVLRLFASEPDDAVRQEMIRVVAGVENRKVTAFLARRLGDPQAEIRACAADALAASANGQGLKLLRRQLKTERDADVRQRIRTSLDARANA